MSIYLDGPGDRMLPTRREVLDVERKSRVELAALYAQGKLSPNGYEKTLDALDAYTAERLALIGENTALESGLDREDA